MLFLAKLNILLTPIYWWVSFQIVVKLLLFDEEKLLRFTSTVAGLEYIWMSDRCAVAKQNLLAFWILQ